MSYVLPFITKRQVGRTGFKLNCNFLLERFLCKEKDAFSVRGSDCCVPPFACQFRKDSNSGDTQILAVASEEGSIILLNSSDSSKEILNHSWIAHNNAVFDICWLPDSPKIISASGDHSAALWDSVTCDRISTFTGHSGSVKCIDVCPQQSCVFATGSRDGTVNVWDTRVQKYINGDLLMKPEITITSYMENKCKVQSFPNKKGKSAASACASRSVTSVAFQDTNHLVSADCGETAIKIWDLRRTYCQKLKVKPNPKYTISYKNTTKCGHGSISMTFDSMRKNLYVCCTDDTIYAIDCHSYSNVCAPAFSGFKAQTYFVKLALSYDDQFLLCGSSDEKAYVWNVTQPGCPLVSLSGHSAEVTAVAWHPQKLTTLATCGDDNKVLIWKIDGKNLSSEENYIGHSKPICDVNKIPENAIVKNSDDSDFNFIPRTKIYSSLKECSLTHFFSHLNSLTPQDELCSTNIEDKVPSKKFKFVQETQNLIYNENIFKTELPCSRKNTDLSTEPSSASFSTHGKENLVRSNSKLFLNEMKHQTSSKKKKTNMAKRCIIMKSKSPVNKKQKRIQENLITCYFQDPSPSKMD